MKSVLFITILAISMAIASISFADPAYVPVTPYMEGNEVVIPPLPAGCTLKNVQTYNDTIGKKKKDLGAVHRFVLKPEESFNFTWEGENKFQELPAKEIRKGIWWQLVTPMSKTGEGLQVACFPGGVTCKYLRN